MKTVLLIRHAQSANNALPENQRVPDPSLTELGKRQAERLADGLRSYPLEQLFCSPFRRSLDTTLPLSLKLGIRPIIKADIYEQGGCYSGYEPGKKRGEPGMCCNQLQQAYPGWAIDPLIGPRGWNVDRDYESCQEVRQRAGVVARWLVEQWQLLRTESMAALVIHADFKRVLLEELLQSSFWASSDEAIWNTAVSEVHFDGSDWQLRRWNSAEHLPESMRSC